jgi:hypothetical protein
MRTRIDGGSRVLLLLLLLTLQVIGGYAIAQEPAAEPAAPAPDSPPPAPLEQTTEVGGEVPPDIIGRWVGFASVKLPSGMKRHFARMWEVTKRGDKYDLRLLFGGLPEGVEERMGKASEAGAEWEATPEDIHQAAEGWDSASKEPPGPTYAQIENRLLAPSAYPPEFERDVITKGSEYALVFNELFARQAVTRTYTVYAIRNREPERMSGTFITSSTAAAPFPIPITLKGEFEAYRLGGEPVAEEGWLQRFLKMFSGCGGQ